MPFVGWISRPSAAEDVVRPEKGVRELKNGIEKAYVEEHVADALRPFVREILGLSTIS
jgi:hypothetical protein|tara:strand:+ start:768 stop:941 length:174 start_codon:yes stop_codon:yes gene_type:complete